MKQTVFTSATAIFLTLIFLTATLPVAAQAEGSGYYQNVGSAYTELNTFRTTKGVWYWNSNNKTKTTFNTNSKNRLPTLRRDAELERVAKTRAKELSRRYSHTRPNGKWCFTAYPSMKEKGENIACGYPTASSVTEALKETNAPYSGQAHRRNMLSPRYNCVGIACYVSPTGTHYWVQSFGYK